MDYALKSHIPLLTQALADAAPHEMVAAMAGPLREMLADGAQQQDDRPKTLAAIEGLTALLASGAFFEPLGTHSFPSRQAVLA